MRNLSFFLAITTFAGLAVGCGRGVPDGDDDDDDVDASTPPIDADDDRPDAEIQDFSKVYAHSGQVLYRLDTETLDPVMIGTFTNTGTQSITDIAIDKDDRMLGITLDRVFEIDETTAEATFLAEMESGTPNLTSLSFVPVDLSQPDGAEILVAAADDGTVYSIDPVTGATAEIGSYGMDGADVIRSSGDIVAVRGVGILATVTIGEPLTDPDYLAVIDPDTWAATPLTTATTYDKIFGIGYWAGHVYGFVDLNSTGTGALIELDPTTGASTLIEQANIDWYGAGVATDAPIVD